MMMRKRTNRCRNTVWDISVISRNKNGETLCGDQCVLEWDDTDATVILSDGLGSGVKANILSTLTTTMLTTMLKGNVPIDECVTTVAETLPMCKERKLAYATFTILQTAGSRARLIQYDNPNAVFVHNGAIGKYNYSVNFIQEKELHESYLHFDVGDMLVLFSDGVSEAGRGVTTDAGATIRPPSPHSAWRPASSRPSRRWTWTPCTMTRPSSSRVCASAARSMS